MNNLFSLLMGMWNFSGIKDKLLQLWVPPETLDGVNFNNVWSLNDLAQKIMPWILANNKELSNRIKWMASMLWVDMQKNVTEVLDKVL